MKSNFRPSSTISKMAKPSKNGGFTLIELMVALLISLIMLGALSVVYSGAFRTNRLQDDLQRVTENGRYAIELMSRDMRMAGYYGCAEDKNPMDGSGPVFSRVTAGNSNFNTMPVHAFENDSAGATDVWYPSDLATEVDPDTAADSDSLIIRMASPVLAANGNPVTVSLMASNLDQIAVSDASDVSVGDVMVLGNCENADIFVASAVTGNDISHQIISAADNATLNNVSDSLTASYGPDAELHKFYSVRYDIRPDAANGGLPTLYRKVNNAPAEALIPGVDNMQLLYGVDTGGRQSPDTYFTASTVPNWRAVRTIKVSLLLRSEQEYGTEQFDGSENATFQVADYTFNDDDSRVRRRLFETTINIRNSY